MRGTRALRAALRQSPSSAGRRIINHPSFTNSSLSTPCGRLALPPTSTRILHNGHRSLSTTTALQKKGANKKNQKATPAAAPAASKADEDEGSTKHPKPDPEEPLDFSDLLSRWQAADEFFADKVKRLKAGGRFNPDVIGSVRVQTDRKSAETFQLRDLAQVVPKGGRTISILVHESQYIKPIMSAVQASPDFNQQPQRDPDNELELILKVEPESRDEVTRRVKNMCDDYRERIRQARGKRHKQHESWFKGKLVSEDLKKTLDTELQKMLEKKLKDVDAKEKDAMKVVAK